jgi:hypothetical protein
MSSTKNSFLTKLGLVLVALALTIICYLFWDPVGREVNYALHPYTKNNVSLTIPNTDFSLIINKLGAVALVIKDVDPKAPNCPGKVGISSFSPTAPPTS